MDLQHSKERDHWVADLIKAVLLNAEGCLRKGKDKLIATNASKIRINFLGAINLETMDVNIAAHETIDSKTMEKYFAALRKKFPKVHLILDNGPYNISKKKQAAKEYEIVLHYLLVHLQSQFKSHRALMENNE